MEPHHHTPRLLTIAGSDSGGGAGIQADLKTFQAFLCYGASVITAITAQNTLGVDAVEGVSPNMVSAQMKSVITDIGADAIKIGMLFDVLIIKTVASCLTNLHPTTLPPIVLDPVMVSTSGHRLLAEEAIAVLREQLVPLCTVLTPNLPEAEILTDWQHGPIKTSEAMLECAKQLGRLGSKWIYLKGGHRPISKNGEMVVLDLLWEVDRQEGIFSERPYQSRKNTHGTGCTLSAAIAAELARELSVPEAVKSAADFVAGAINSSYSIGSGSGPVNHAFQLMHRIVPAPTKSSPHPFTDLLVQRAGEAWQRYVNHPFTERIAKGDIPLPSYLFFVRQDYHFLVQYARTNALAAYKTDNLPDMQASMVICDAIIKETDLHIKKCEEYGISKEALLSTPESTTNIAYTRYVLDIGASGDLLALRVATAPCLLGYGEAGLRLLNAPNYIQSSKGNPFWYWIEEYGGIQFQTAVKAGKDILDSMVSSQPVAPKRLQELIRIFNKATELEIAFWDEAMATTS